MRTIPNEYLRARVDRKRKAIIYSICAGGITALLGLTGVHIILFSAIAWLAAWEIGTHRVKVIRRIYMPGENE
jgi:hypothetical protein